MSTTHKGVTIIAVGGQNKRSEVYGKFAYNLARSLKYHSPDIKIHLVWNDVGIRPLNTHQQAIFDYDTKADEDHCFTDGLFTPSKIKMHLYEYLYFDETIYIDADSLLIKPIEPLFDICTQDYYTSLLLDEETNLPATANKDTMDFKYMMWATPEQIWGHYGLNGETMPATNSSFQFIRKSKTCEKLFRQILANYDDRIPARELQQKWGKGGQPDELYLNVALAQLGMLPYLGEEPVMYGHDRVMDIQKDYEDHYFLTFFGHKSYTEHNYIRQGEMELRKVYKPEHVMFKLTTMMRDKYLNIL